MICHLPLEDGQKGISALLLKLWFVLHKKERKKSQRNRAEETFSLDKTFETGHLQTPTVLMKLGL